MLQLLVSDVRKADQEYHLIQNGDKIAVGLSGGKDSVTLLHLLKHYQRFSKNKFELMAISLNPGDVDYSSMNSLCNELQIPFVEVKTNIEEILFTIRKEKNPCSLCAKLRRGILHEEAKKHGCTKVALGHHKDDALETLLLNMSYEGRIRSFSPKTYLSRADLTLIRPMVFIEEQQIKKFAKKFELPIVVNPCPVDGYTKRENMKKLIETLNADIPNFKKNLFNSLTKTEDIFLWNAEEIKKEGLN